MKKLMWMLVLIGVFGIGAGTAGAVVDPTPDLLGVYFDMNADVPDISVAAFVPFTAYFLLTSPSSVEMGGYEFGYDVSVAPGMESSFNRLGINYPPGVIVLDLEYLDPMHGYFIVGWPTPQPTQAVTQLMSWDLMLMQPIVAFITTGPVPNSTVPGDLPAYWDSTNVYPLGAPGCSGRINESCGVEAETASFGSVKSLYR